MIEQTIQTSPKKITSTKQFLFIIGAPRSGTSWLQLMLGACPSVSTTVELRVFSRYIHPWIEAWKEESSNINEGRWYQGLPVLWTEEEFYNFLYEFLEKVYQPVWMTKPQATHILDKHPAYSLFVDEINLLIPNALFIHIIRDGRDVAASLMAAKKQIGFGYDTIQASAAGWKKHVQSARRASQYYGRYLEIKYEDLVEDGINLLKSVFDFCGLDATVDNITDIYNTHSFEKIKAQRMSPVEGLKAPEGHYRKGKAGTWREELKPKEKYLFDQIAGDLLKELGYAEDDWWADSLYQSCTIPLQNAIKRRTGIKSAVFRCIKLFLGPKLSSYLKSIFLKPRHQIH
jgi:Sulfotransferase family